MTKLPTWAKKLPKKVTICGKVYHIEYNMTRSGAAFWTGECIIEVGCDFTQDRVRCSLVHEINEIVHCEMRFRTKNEDGYRFSMNHAEFQQHNTMMCAALVDCGLLK